MLALASTFPAGFGVGLAVAAPIGPMGMLCIQRTLSDGMRAGVATGLGAATVHAVYGAAAILGVEASMLALVESQGWVLRLLSAGLLMVFAVRLLRRRDIAVARAGASTHPLRCYRDALILGIANPLTLVLLTAFVPTVGMPAQGVGMPEMLLGLVCGSIAWWLVLSSSVSLLRTRLSARVLNATNVAAALAFSIMAGFMIATTIGRHLNQTL